MKYTMRLHIDNLSEYVPVKLLETHDAIGDTANDSENFSKELSEKYYSKNIEVRIDEKEDGKIDIWEVKNERISVGLDLSVKLDYRADNPCVSIDDDSTAFRR